ncbi:MAG: MBL fold metallo-hydrolase [Acidobacteriota bacterium]
MRVTMLGSGTSTGVPVIGCTCAVCRSTDPRNRRLRPGLKIEVAGGVVLVDTPTDFREQALRFGVPQVDAVLFTHAHADHVFGLDDLRIFNFRQRAPIACYGSASTLGALRRMFAYIFEDGQEGGGKPKLDLVEVNQAFTAAGATFEPIPVLHGDLPVLGYRSGGFAYVTDCNSIPPESMARLRGLDVLILDALRYRSHPTHFSIDEALAVVADLTPRRTILTHIAHEVEHAEASARLPAGVEIGYDGLIFDVD